MSDGLMTIPCELQISWSHPNIWIQFISLINVYSSLLRVVSLSIGGLSHMLTHSLPRCLSRTHALDITLPPSRNHLQLFSLTFITSTLLLQTYTRTILIDPFYIHGPAYVSHVRTLSLRLSLTHYLTPLFLIDEYDSSRAFCRMPLKVRLDE